MTARWYIVRVEAGRENLAKAFIREAGYEVYFPVRTARYRIRGKTRDKSFPLVRGYIFAKCAMNAHDWAAIEAARGVLELLPYAGSDDGVPCPVSDGEVESWMKREANGEFDGVKRAIERERRKRYHRRWKPLDQLGEVIHTMLKEQEQA